MVKGISESIKKSNLTSDKHLDFQRALEYMGLNENIPINEISVDKVFIGSCTNSRIEDLREAARYLKGKKINLSIKLAMAVPGSGIVKQAESEGLDKIFIESGFQWRDPGCSMCLAMNADRLESGERCASTSNRNFEGRQGQGGRTHLVSPAMAKKQQQFMAILLILEMRKSVDKFKHIVSKVIPLDRSNVDTDAIIPKQFLKSIKRTGFGANLFDEWRYLDHGEPGKG